MKNKLFLFIFLILSIYFLSCQQTSTAPKETESASTEEEKKENKDTFSVSIISNREIYTDQFTGTGEYKPGEKVTIKMNWLDKGDNFIGFYDDAYNELDKNQFFSFFMPCHDCIVNALFYKEGDKPLKVGDYVYTIDKIFLPSVKDCSTAEYGFYTDDDGWDPARKFLPTQYSKAMGIRVYHGFYEFSDKWNIFSEARAFGYATHVWTRSGSNNWGSFILQSGIPSNHQGILVMNCLGDIEELIYTSRTFVGVAPALVVSLE